MLKTVDELLDEFNVNAKAAGIPRDQARVFAMANYFPTPKQMEFHAVARVCDASGGPNRILYGGARGGGKSHCEIAQPVLDDMQRFPGLKALFLRRIKLSAEESLGDLARRVLSFSPAKVSGKGIALPNGSFMRYGGFKDANDIDKYLGIEYDLIVLEEATQLRFDVYEKVQGSLRSSRLDGYRERMYLSCNPGGVGHRWAKNDFIIPHVKGQETDTRFIKALPSDNPYLSADYVAYLDRLSPALRKAWRDGDWDIEGGLAFPTFSVDIHVKDDWQIDPSWLRFRGIDTGYSAPYCCLWGAYDPVWNRMVVYREDYETHLTNTDQAQRINLMTPTNEWIAVTYADPALWITSAIKEVTSAVEVYASHGIYLTKGDNRRVPGRHKILDMLGIRGDGYPGLIILKNCASLIEQLSEIVVSEKNPEDADTTKEDHAYDPLRYMLSSVRPPAVLTAESQRQNNQGYTSDLARLFPN